MLTSMHNRTAYHVLVLTTHLFPFRCLQNCIKSTKITLLSFQYLNSQFISNSLTREEKIWCLQQSHYLVWFNVQLCEGPLFQSPISCFSSCVTFDSKLSGCVMPPLVICKHWYLLFQLSTVRWKLIKWFKYDKLL